MTDLQTTPTTLLQAINLMLAAIAVDAVDSLDDINYDTNVGQAFIALNDASMSIQLGEGISSNVETDYPLVPGEDGTVALPANTIKFRLSPRSGALDVVQRGLRLYDRKGHTYKFDKTVYGDLTIGLDWDEMPQAMRSYIFNSAGLTFVGNRIQSGQAYRFSQAKLEAARLAYEQAEMEQGGMGLQNAFAQARRNRFQR
jgi:hypothetical protein